MFHRFGHASCDAPASRSAFRRAKHYYGLTHENDLWPLFTWLLYAMGCVWRFLVHRPRGFEPIDPRRVRSILLIRLDELGDFVLFSAILRPLRKAFPNAHISLVLSDWVCPMAELCPYTDEVIPFPSQGPRWRQFLLGPFRALRTAVKLGRQFDLAINPRFDRDIRGAAFLAHFSLARRVLGYPSSTEAFKAAANRGYDRFYTHLLPAPPDVRHEIERSGAVLDYLGIPRQARRPELWISNEDRGQADRLLQQEGWRPGDVLLCLGISAALPRRRWPMDSFRELALRLSPEVTFLIVGSPSDREAAELLRPALGSRLINLAGRAPLRVSAAALDRCYLYVGNDSGPMHLAAALAKPVIEISCHPKDGDPAHFQSPRRFQPVSVSATVLAPAHALAPCNAACLSGEPHCITQISVDEVLEAVALKETVGVQS